MKITNPMAPEQLRKIIADELNSPSVDDFRIAQLVSQLLDLDEGRVRFTVDATHVQRLGRELVAKQETALAELIKNAYDADAAIVLIDIKPPSEGNSGSIMIQDDGLGMKKEDVRRGWMRLSTDAKVDDNHSPNYRRLRAGRKGIGRFAVERLGQRLDLETRRRDETKGYRISFDWDRDFTRGQELGLIAHAIEEFDKPSDDQGTTLTISGLRDNWDEGAIRAAWKMVFQLQAPIDTPPQATSTQNSQIDPGFQVYIDSQNAQGARVSLSLEEEFASLAIAEISGELQSDGTVIFTVDSAKLNFHDEQKMHRADLAGLGPVKLTVQYMIFDNNAMPGVKLKQAIALTKELGGIKLYRNGFRVAPYGEEGDDWLSLARDTARRAILIPANNQNFAGRVHVSSQDNPNLEETASREGLIEGPAYYKLVSFVKDCLWWGAKRVGSARERKTEAGQKDFSPRRPQSLHSHVSALTQKLREAKDSAEVDAAIDEILRVASEYEQQTDVEREESLKYEAMLRVLASLGLTIAVFSHEVSGSTALLTAAINNLVEKADTLQEPIRTRMLEGIASAGRSSQRITDLGGYLGSLTTQSESRKLRTLVVKTLAENFKHQFFGYAEGIGIELEIMPINPVLRTCPMHRSEFDSVLFNFFSNSIKAIKRAQRSAPKIRLSAVQDKRFVLIRFQDTGDGIRPEYRDRVFDAFFTTSGDDGSEGEGSGTGLGLRIVSDIATSYGGTVVLSEPDDGFITSFELRIPRYDSARHSL
jgi:signal transduction histidine kinase